MNLFDQQTANRRKTWLIMGVFVALLVLMGLGFDSFMLGVGGGNVPVGTFIALAVGSSSALASYFGGARVVLLSTGATPIAQAATAADADLKLRLRQLDNIVDEMSIASGLPRPDTYIVPESDPNAFATGRGPGHASIAVTRGLVETLNREELQGVVAHEMSHIRNLDVRLMTIVAALIGAIALLADWARRVTWLGGPRRRDGRDGVSGAARGLFFCDLASRNGTGSARRPCARDDGVPAPRIPCRCFGCGAHEKSPWACEGAGENRGGWRTHPVDPAGVGAPVHYRPAGAQGEPRRRILVGPVCVSSPNGPSDRGTQGHGIRALTREARRMAAFA